jgi:hypothetical protein
VAIAAAGPPRACRFDAGQTKQFGGVIELVALQVIGAARRINDRCVVDVGGIGAVSAPGRAKHYAREHQSIDRWCRHGELHWNTGP